MCYTAIRQKKKCLSSPNFFGGGRAGGFFFCFFTTANEGGRTDFKAGKPRLVSQKFVLGDTTHALAMKRVYVCNETRELFRIGAKVYLSKKSASFC